MTDLLTELKRRKVFRVAVVYAATAFAVLQGADILLPNLGVPAWAMRFLVAAVVLGFPIALVLAANRIATGLDGRQVATVGRIQAFPGAPNVIPGKVVLSLEIRDLAAERMQQVFELVRTEASRIADAGRTPIDFLELDAASPPAPTAMAMREIIELAASRLGLSSGRMPSGAGHDAQDLAQIAPTGMLFVPSIGGISHAPDEYTRPEDMTNGATVLLHTVLAVDQGALEAPFMRQETRAPG